MTLDFVRAGNSKYSTNNDWVGNPETNRIDFTASYHQTELDAPSIHLTVFMAMGGLVYQLCEPYIDDVLIYGRDIESFLANVRKVFER